MTALEKLARRICWLEFVGKPPGDMTEAQYWALRVHPDAKEKYRESARWLAFIMGAINRNVSSQAILSRARKERT